MKTRRAVASVHTRYHAYTHAFSHDWRHAAACGARHAGQHAAARRALGGCAWGVGKRGHKLHHEHEEDKLAVVALAPACAHTHVNVRARTTRARGTRHAAGHTPQRRTRTCVSVHEGALACAARSAPFEARRRERHPCVTCGQRHTHGETTQVGNRCEQCGAVCCGSGTYLPARSVRVGVQTLVACDDVLTCSKIHSSQSAGAGHAARRPGQRVARRDWGQIRHMDCAECAAQC